MEYLILFVLILFVFYVKNSFARSKVDYEATINAVEKACPPHVWVEKEGLICGTCGKRPGDPSFVLHQI